MDLYAAVKLYQNNKENFEDTPSAPDKEKTKSTVRIISFVISLLISVYAVSLSWSCNTALGINTGLKVLYAFFAFIFGLFYLIFYMIFRAGTCKNYIIVKSSPPSGGRKN
jgi:hypothetical protein